MRAKTKSTTEFKDGLQGGLENFKKRRMECSGSKRIRIFVRIDVSVLRLAAALTLYALDTTISCPTALEKMEKLELITSMGSKVF